jgi:hypothetical protein
MATSMLSTTMPSPTMQWAAVTMIDLVMKEPAHPPTRPPDMLIDNEAMYGNSAG